MANIIGRINTIEKIVTPENQKINRKQLLALEAERKYKLIGRKLDKYMKVKKKL